MVKLGSNSVHKTSGVPKFSHYNYASINETLDEVSLIIENFVVRKGRFWGVSEGQLIEVGAKEVWNASMSQAYPELQDLEVLSFGSFAIEAFSASDSTKTRVIASAFSDGISIGVPLNEVLTIDHVATEKFLIPLHLDYMNSVERGLRPLINRMSETEPEGIASELVKLSRRLGFKLEFSQDFLEALSLPPKSVAESPTDSELWDYQKVGFTWMLRLWRNSLGGILGDEMGVGKTLQLIALSCQVATIDKRPALIVVPAGLLLKWCKDFIDHAPSFMAEVHVHNGPNRPKSVSFLQSQRIILTTYSMVVQDEDIFAEIDFSSIACDEAHELKESRTLKSRAMRNLRAQGKYLATGTPIQNNLSDYWSLIDIIEPGLLGSKEYFEGRGEDTPALAAKLVDQTKHRVLRRTQEQVGIDIPEGQEFYVPLALSPELQNQYKKLRQQSALPDRQSAGYSSLSYRRQFCAHPASFEEYKLPFTGQKSDYLINELEKINELSEKLVIFVADFNEPRDLYLQLIKEEFPSIWTGTIDGRTANDLRHVLLEEFSHHEGTAALLINPQVGGQGLDIVAANHVFHMNPAWNPAKTDQATFRVTRPGQTRETWSHHLYYVDTIEEHIYNLVLNKRELSEAALEVAEADSETGHKSLISFTK